MGGSQETRSDGVMDTKVLGAVKDIVAGATNIVFFGGAGVSTTSGIPDFRSATGLYNQRRGSKYPPETMLSRAFMLQHPQEFYDYHLNNLIARDAKPNPAHLSLAALEEAGKLKAIITQNIDGLHQAAGSKNVIELHGNTYKFYCMGCGTKYDLAFVDSANSLPPTCSICGKMVRPDVVLYGEALDAEVMQAAIDAIRKAEVLIVGGTSLVVYPAAGLIDYYSGKNLVLVNREETPLDYKAKYVLHGDIAEILPVLAGMFDPKTKAW